ncbi:TSUP family transporter [Candidatus Laterigemmans baculatus]|uniref:TSUP family transporter n=1 Tax=Candidatus Laterigemmans baculatus TaxID=2770505 RepID=UPI0013D9ACD7|nr:TSUP family transporter [Candidatus Laterigemmans baculatus]
MLALATLPDPASLALLAVVLCVGIFVQAAAGFAAGLLIIPLLLWCGFSIPEAQVSLLVATVPQNLWGVWKFRGTIRPGEVAFPALLRLLWLPLGVGVLVSLENLPSVRIRQVVGGVTLVVTLAIMLWRPQPRQRLHAGWSLVAFSVSGFLQGLVGMGGPAMVLWVQAHDWDTRRMRAFLFTMYLISLAPAILILWWFFGSRLLLPGLATMVLIPLLLAVTAVGLRTGTWLGRQRLRQVTLGLLLLLGVAGVCTPWLTPSEPSSEPSSEAPRRLLR